MSLRIGNTAPDFKADTTTGQIQFHDWIGDGWAFFFSHPADFTPVCTTEMGRTAQLADQFAARGVTVNAVAPGPIWTPLIPSTFENVEDFGQDSPLGRPGQPSEVAPAFVYLACRDSSYVTGQVIHVNGGSVVGG